MTPRVCEIVPSQGNFVVSYFASARLQHLTDRNAVGREEDHGAILRRHRIGVEGSTDAPCPRHGLKDDARIAGNETAKILGGQLGVVVRGPTGAERHDDADGLALVEVLDRIGSGGMSDEQRRGDGRQGGPELRGSLCSLSNWRPSWILPLRDPSAPLAAPLPSSPAAISRPSPTMTSSISREQIEPRLRRDMRRQDHVVELQKLVVGPGRLLIERIEREAGKPAGLQRVDERAPLHHVGARDVDEHRARLHLREPARSMQAARRRIARQLRDDPIARPPAALRASHNSPAMPAPQPRVSRVRW